MKNCELFRLYVEKRTNNNIEMNFIDNRCQYIYCPLEELKQIVEDTRLCIGDYSVLRALRVNTARPVTNEELFD